MIGFLNGILLEKNPESLLVLVGGVGYEVEVPASSLCALPSLNSSVSLYVYTHVREDALRLFGFTSLFDKHIFTSLLQVSGIGPKAALALLSVVDGVELCSWITQNQVARLTSIPGIGAKSAERLVLELKTKLQKLQARYLAEPLPEHNPSLLFADGLPREKTMAQKEFEEKKGQLQMVDDLKSALTNLGYKDKQVSPVVDKLSQKMKAGESFPFEVALKQALKDLSGHVFKH